ncbi:MAG: glycogen synthase GlgA [Deltaproteobacteria bacterium]|nr:glycogen synthase GlgA [Deltaproteobacteria bacterium]
MKPGAAPPSVVFASAELAPLAATGGLGDVSRALPRALAGALGGRVSVFLPLYQAVRRRGVELEHAATVDVPGHGPGFRVWRAAGVLDPAALYLVEHDPFFDRPGLYGERGGDYDDNLERFAFFSRAVLEAILALDLPADVVHANDWHTALVPAHLRWFFAGHPRLRAAATVFTIHNLAFQGRFAAERLPSTGLPPAAFHMDGIEYYGRINLMKAGIAYSRAITTVSPRYAAEICTPELGEGLDGLLRARAADLRGILNGIDTEAWNPSIDRHLPARYAAGALGGKRICKHGLVAELGLGISLDTPLVGMVTRLTLQKGCDLVLGAAAELLRQGVGLAVLGSGDPWLEEGFRNLAGAHPGRVAVRIGYDESLSHRIEAGADLFLMPSRYEPCGLNQMYSLRYGTVPVVRATGGLDDTVRDADEDPRRGNGFKFREPRGDELAAALRRAVRAYHEPARWERLQQTGMAEDFSWSLSARRYAEIYDRLREDRRGVPS